MAEIIRKIKVVHYATSYAELILLKEEDFKVKII